MKTWYHLLKVGIWIASTTATLFYVFSTKNVSFLHTFQGHFHLSGFNSKQQENGAIQTDMALNISADNPLFIRTNTNEDNALGRGLNLGASGLQFQRYNQSFMLPSYEE